MPETRTFICFACLQSSETEWTEDEARAEAESRYGTMPQGDPNTNPSVVSLCDSCDKAVQAILRVYGIQAGWTEETDRVLSPLTGLKVFCFRCHRTPMEIEEYRDMVAEEGDRVSELSCMAYVVAEEGTYNQANGHFCCTECYVALGMPTEGGHGWKAP